MHVWKVLRERIDELRLTALQREIARGLKPLNASAALKLPE
jgi:hypothetical protein